MNRLPLLVALLSFTASALFGFSAASGQAPPPDPTALVQQAADFLQKQDKFSVGVELFGKVEAPNANQQNVAKYKLVVNRPNQFAMTYQEGDGGVSLFSNGQELTTFLPNELKYAVESAPESLGELFESEAGKILGGQFAGAGGFVMCLLDPNPAEKLLQDVTSAKYIGREEIQGRPYHHCRFEEEQFDWDIWIAAEGEPTIAKIQPDMSKRLAGNPAAANIKFEVRLTFSDWDFAPQIEASTFAFTPPEDAEKLDSFFQQQAEQGPHPLLGKVAPPFNIEDLEGKPVDLARYSGKDIVILDFWATWCGPCIAAMPEVKAAADKFADRGVVLYFVNLQEDLETIHEFLKEHELDVPVALDTEGVVAAEYGVTGIPQTVIVGKDGKVQVVHVGFGENLQKQLTTELEALLAGKDLAAEELKKYEKKTEENAETSGVDEQ